MDVTEQEPLPPVEQALGLPQVIITPHVGGQAAWRNDKITDLFCRNLVRWKQGRPLINYLCGQASRFSRSRRGIIHSGAIAAFTGIIVE